MSNQFWLSAAQFARLQPLLPTDTRGVPPPALLLDATHVKAHRSAAGGKGGRRSTPVRLWLRLKDQDAARSN